MTRPTIACTSLQPAVAATSSAASTSSPVVAWMHQCQPSPCTEPTSRSVMAPRAAAHARRAFSSELGHAMTHVSSQTAAIPRWHAGDGTRSASCRREVDRFTLRKSSHSEFAPRKPQGGHSARRGMRIMHNTHEYRGCARLSPRSSVAGHEAPSPIGRTKPSKTADVRSEHCPYIAQVRRLAPWKPRTSNDVSLSSRHWCREGRW